MILVADSGATKSDWVLIDDRGDKKPFVTIGLNPFYVSTKEIEKILRKDLLPFLDSKRITDVFFYSAGCSTVYKSMTVEDALVNLFRKAEVTINSDMFGAAKALFGDDEGIACILGTGSNSCHFNGTEIVKNVISLGYFFGDEGSGAHMGKTFMRDYLMGNIPKEIDTAFREEYNYTRDNVLDAVYNLPFPNRFLASFNEFYSEHLSNKYVFDLVTNSFREFFLNQIEHYEDHQELPVSFVGSVAYYFEPLLRQIASEFDVNVKKVLRTPIDALAVYHANK
jgi:N-acetylglucosamine kinase-like BadF-type ATPase